jgi:integrase/recombinase XerD
MQHLLNPFISYLMTQRCVAYNTSLAYRRDVQQFLKFWDKLSQQQKKDWRMVLIDFRDFLRKHEVGGRSISRKLSALRAFFKYVLECHPAELKGHDISLVVGLPPRLDRRLPRVCSPDDIAKLFQVAQQEKDGVRAELICYLLYTVGLRVSELVQLRRENIHSATGRITLRGKGGKMRTIPLVARAQNAIENYDTWLQNRGGTTLNSRLPYINLSRQSVWRLIKKLARAAKISTPVSPHVLRHSLATHSLEEGWDLRSLQLMLGHERIATTEMYIHLDTRFVKSEYKKRHPRG